MGMRL